MRISDWSSDVCSSDLLVVKAQRLRRPAGDRQIALPADPLDLESRAQPVVAADVIAAHEGAVGRDAARIAEDRKSTRRTPVTNAHIVCRLLLEKKNQQQITPTQHTYRTSLYHQRYTY